MRPLRIFLWLIFLGLVALAAWFWFNRDGAPAEVEIAMEPSEPVIEADDVPNRKPDSPVIPDADPAPVDVAPDPYAAFDASDCRWLVRHIPDADVAYKPGVDVHGKPVVPADLNGTYNLELPETVIASVSRRLLKHRNLRQETPFAEIEINIETGAIRINGQGLDNADQERLIAYCRDRD